MNSLGFTYCFKSLIYTPASQFQDLLDRIVTAAVDEVSRAEFPSVFQLVVEQVDRDDLPGTGEYRALYGIEANTATADDRYRRSCFDASCVDH